MEHRADNALVGQGNPHQHIDSGGLEPADRDLSPHQPLVARTLNVPDQGDALLVLLDHGIRNGRAFDWQERANVGAPRLEARGFPGHFGEALFPAPQFQECWG